jgi:hypothetical protein
MGNGLKRVTTPETQVTQGDANTLQIGCVTTPTPKGGVGGGDALATIGRGGDARPPLALVAVLRRAFALLAALAMVLPQ